MENFTAGELKLLNQITLSIHKTDSLIAMCDAVLQRLPELIPHEKSFFTHHPTPDTPDSATCRSLSMLSEELAEYTGYFIDLDYTAWYLKQANVTVYRDSDVVGEPVMKSSSIYTDWVLRMGMRYVCGNVIRLDDRIYADFTLFRTEEHGDFSDREMFLLQLVTDQLSLWFQKHYAPALLTSPSAADDPLAVLTPREQEIAQLASCEIDFHEIADQLSISYSTVRRHMANIYQKLGINSRSQLIIMLLKS